MSFDADSRRVIANVWINNSSYPVDVRNVNYRVEVNSNSDIILPGCAACAIVDVKIHGVIDEDLIGLPVRISFNAFDNCETGGSAVTAFLGDFIITGQENIKGTGATIIHATDIMEKLDKTDYVSELSFPATTHEIVQEVSKLSGVAVYWDVPGNMTGLEAMTVKDKPEGYTCREVLSYIAGMYGKYIIDSSQVSTGNITYSNSVVMRGYTDDGAVIIPSVIHRGGLEMKTVDVQQGTPTVYVESAVTVTEAEPSHAPEGSPLGDIRYIQNPDELKDEIGYCPYWVLCGPLEIKDGSAPRYYVYFTEQPTTFSLQVSNYDSLGAKLYMLKSPDGVSHSYSDNFQYGALIINNPYDWEDRDGGKIRYDDNDYVMIYGYVSGGFYDGKQDYDIVASNYDVYDTETGELIFAKNDSLVGSLRIPGKDGDVEVEYGDGDYTNPFIDKDNVSVSQSMQQEYICWPGTLKWRGDPKIRPGTKITIIDRNGISIPFFICSLHLFYDGGMYMEAECHGSVQMFNKTPGVQRELKQIRAMKSIWEATK